MRIEGVIDKGRSRASEPRMIERRGRPRVHSILAVLVFIILGVTFLSALIQSKSPVNENAPILRFAGAEPPVVYVPSNIVGSAGASLQVYIVVFEPDGDTMHVEFEWGDGTPNGTYESAPGFEEITTIYHAWNPVPIQGRGDYDVSYTLNITAYDPDNMSGSASIPISIMIGFNYPPSIYVNTPTSPVDPDDNISIEVYASDGEGEPLTWTYVFNNTDLGDEFWTFVRYTGWSTPNEVLYNNVSYAFGAEGNYSLTVYVSDALPGYQVGIHNTSLKSLNIEVIENSAPICTPIAFAPYWPFIDSSIGYVDVDFIIEVLDVDADPINATWDFGDGSPGESNSTPGGRVVYTFNQTHRYYDAGFFNVSMTFTDGRPGHEVTEYVIINITSNNMPPEIVYFQIETVGPQAFVGETVRFTAEIMDPEHDSIETIWSFGDSGPMTYLDLSEYTDFNVTAFVNHTYTSPGIYLVTLRYSDGEVGIGNHSKQFNVSVTVIVDAVAPVADAGADQSVLSPAVVAFNGTASNDNWGIANFTWTFIYNGSLQTLWGPDPSFEFWSPGTYDVTLNVTDLAGNYDTDIVTIEVTDAIPEFGSFLPVIVGVVLISVACGSRRRGRAR